MKPALLYLRKYIEQNYNGDRYQDSDKKNQKESQLTKCSQEAIFKEKSKYEWLNQNKKEFYFKVPKSFNSSKILKKIPLQERTTHQTHNSYSSYLKPKNNITVQKISQQQIKEKEKQQIRAKNIEKKEKSNIQDCYQINNNLEKQVKFVISPPKKLEKIHSESSRSFQQFYQEINHQQNQNEKHVLSRFAQKSINQQWPHQKIEQKEKNILQVPRQSEQQQQKNDHIKLSCKSMKKVGYDNLSDYLQQMKNLQKINKKQIKQACYYPLACMKPSTKILQSYEKDSKVLKKQFQKKLESFKKIIQIQENFTSNIIQKQLKNTISCNGLKSKKSNFSKNKNIEKKGQENFEQKGKKFLLEYQKIVICNCANKKFFTFQLSKEIDYNSFLKVTTSLLETTPFKDNKNLLGNQAITSEIDGFHFCCLINSKQYQKESFFWIGKPIQYYRKNLIIEAIDNFLLELNAFTLIEGQKIWIVDYNGKNSFVLKKMLVKCNQEKKSNNISLPKREKSRVSKRISLSQQFGGLELTESLINLMTNSSEFHESVFVKKQRNNISTRGAFQMVYQSKESLK